MFEDKEIATTTNGTKLYTNSYTESLSLYAAKKLGDNHRVFLAETPNNYKSYILVKGQEVIHDEQSLEAMGTYIDFLKVAGT